MRKPDQSGGVNRKILIWISIPVILVGLVLGWWSITRSKHLRHRASWKTVALERLSGLSLTNQDISRELATLKANQASEKLPRWTGETVLLMTNDEYLVYASLHGLKSAFVDDLFLARGSDGRWYYTTYHFCHAMVGARADDPPSSITDFKSKYAAREFDGKSDVCLEHTWPEKN